MPRNIDKIKKLCSNILEQLNEENITFEEGLIIIGFLMIHTGGDFTTKVPLENLYDSHEIIQQYILNPEDPALCLMVQGMELHRWANVIKNNNKS